MCKLLKICRIVRRNVKKKHCANLFDIRFQDVRNNMTIVGFGKMFRNLEN